MTWGDPFNGSKVKGYNGPIKVFCMAEDAVCEGRFKLGLQHLAYSFSPDVGEAVEFLKKTAGSKKRAVEIWA